MSDAMALSDEHRAQLADAKALLEHPGLSVKVSNLIGKPIEKGFELLPQFCAQCGTTVMLSLQKSPALRIAAGGTFDEPGWFEMDRHIWTRSALHWMSYPPDIATFDQGFVL